MEPQTAALVEEAPSVNHSAASVEEDSSSQGDATARLIHYPRSATVFAATASIIFIIVGILGELFCFCFSVGFMHHLPEAAHTARHKPLSSLKGEQYVVAMPHRQSG